jgi:hypothetical protein
MQHLAQIPFPEVQRVVATGRSLVIVPVGVVEEHGPPRCARAGVHAGELRALAPFDH